MDVPLFVSWLDAVRKMPCFNLRSLSLVVDDISDDLFITVVHSVPRLVELDIEGQTFYGAIDMGLDQHWTAGSEVLRIRLELVKLGGFAKVKKFEVLTSPILSDLLFDDMIGVARDGNSKRHRTGEEVGGGSGGDEGGGGRSKGDFEPSMDRFPKHIKIKAFEKIDLSSLCTVTCVSPIFNSAFTHFPSVSSSDLSPDEGSEAEMVRSCDKEGHGCPSAEV
ncbi:hypothetical protein CQW23_18163 [Capsicum baccatum]|uniref:F-box domain-containing protein n=1 Tax=Capsicum baccatum TaxID=33114 RepID=A0A2G2WFW4_CAPBA|nr:hypothetical protein CQW23_18163 [Capsicum baccatum]